MATAAEWVAKEIAGDWEAVAKAGSAVQNLGNFTKAFADAVNTGADTMFQGWEGNAATAAAGYFDQIPEALKARPVGAVQGGGSEPFADPPRAAGGGRRAGWRIPETVLVMPIGQPKRPIVRK